METPSSIKSKFFTFIKTNTFLYFVISVIFFFIWSRLLIERGTELPIWLLMGGGLILPFILLIGAIQYKSKIAYAVTLMIFYWCILFEMSALYFNAKFYFNDSDGSIFSLSFCPLCEIKTNLQFIVACSVALFLMGRKGLLESFDWETTHSYQLFFIGLIVFLICYLF